MYDYSTQIKYIELQLVNKLNNLNVLLASNIREYHLLNNDNLSDELSDSSEVRYP
jgi:hypothetical protein